MPANTVYITSVRHPASQFESMYKCYKLSNRFGVNIRQFAKSPLKYFLKRQSDSKRLRQSGVNPFFFYLGLKKKHLRAANRIKRKIREIANNFNLVLIFEHFDQPLILLMLWWEFMDVAYFTVNARIEDEVEELWQETKGNLTAWNKGDMMLYNHFNKTLFKKCWISFWKDEIRFRNIPRSDWSIEGNLFEWRQTHTRWKNKDIAYEAKRMPSSEDNYLCKSLTWKPQEHLEDLRKNETNVQKVIESLLGI